MKKLIGRHMDTTIQLWCIRLIITHILRIHHQRFRHGPQKGQPRSQRLQLPRNRQRRLQSNPLRRLQSHLLWRRLEHPSPRRWLLPTQQRRHQARTQRRLQLRAQQREPLRQPRRAQMGATSAESIPYFQSARLSSRCTGRRTSPRAASSSRIRSSRLKPSRTPWRLSASTILDCAWSPRRLSSSVCQTRTADRCCWYPQ